MPNHLHSRIQCVLGRWELSFLIGEIGEAMALFCHRYGWNSPFFLFLIDCYTSLLLVILQLARTGHGNGELPGSSCLYLRVSRLLISMRIWEQLVCFMLAFVIIPFLSPVSLSIWRFYWLEWLDQVLRESTVAIVNIHAPLWCYTWSHRWQIHRHSTDGIASLLRAMYSQFCPADQEDLMYKVHSQRLDWSVELNHPVFQSW